MQMHIQQTGEVVEILCVCFDFHTSNIQRARTERLAQYIVRSGNPILRSPEGRSLTAGVTIICTTERHAFSRVSAIERVQRLFFAYFFLARQNWDQTANQRSVCCLERTSSAMDETCRLRRGEGYEACEDECPRSDSCGVTAKTAPPVNPEKSSRILRMRSPAHFMLG